MTKYKTEEAKLPESLKEMVKDVPNKPSITVKPKTEVSTEELKKLKDFLEKLETDWHIKQQDLANVLTILIHAALKEEEKK